MTPSNFVNTRRLSSKPSSKRCSRISIASSSSSKSAQLFDEQLRRLCPTSHYHPKIVDPIRAIVNVLLPIFLQEQLKCTSNKTLKSILTNSIENYGVKTSQIYQWLFNNQNTYLYKSLLGFFLMVGIGCRRDKKSAFSLFLAAAKKGYLIAQELVGDCYFFGIGTHENADLAFLWYSKCAEQGSGYGYHGLGICYEKGKGTERFLPLAIEYYKISAMKGNVWGMIQLARRYQIGVGILKNIDKSIYWYQRALEIGCEKAKNELEKLMNSPLYSSKCHSSFSFRYNNFMSKNTIMHSNHE
ncbi:24728_t:CDS:1 [Gigaspora margarita]|uniref:24728_t:CDS:1 n=1 Tax=Gigaspora margarita TaxID=4874 RepID=A0ABN7UDN1_GIGMA|nr:24728_t:CDS:1 [Gigaspora margarita]